MAKRIIAIFSVTHATTALRDLSLWLGDQVPPGPDWRSLVKPVHGLDRRIQQLAGRVIRLAGEIRETRCRGLRLGVVPNDNPAALTRIDLRIEPSRLLRRDTTEKALKKLLELLRLLAGSGWWGVNAVTDGTQTWSLRVVVAEVIALARTFDVEVAPIAYPSRVDPRPSAMPGSQQVGDRPRFGKTRPSTTRASDDDERPTRKAARGSREPATRVSVSQTSSVRTSTATSTTTRTTTSQTTAKTSAGSSTRTTKKTSTTSTKAKNPGKVGADTPSAKKAEEEAPRQAPPADTAGKKKKAASGASSKKQSKHGGSFGGLPDDEMGSSGPADAQAPLSEEARLFLSYGQLTWPCAEAELRSVHRQIVKTLHPDRHPGDAAAGHRFMWLQRGYEALRAKLASADAPARVV